MIAPASACPGPCPEADALLALLDGSLDETGAEALEAHLEDCERCDRAVVELATMAGDDARGPGDMVGRYRLERCIGTGGMGLVYAAFDPQLQRQVAIKLVRPGMCSARARRRLVREAQLLAALSHPNVVPVFDVGVAGDDVFMACELVRGATVRDWSAAEKPSWRTIVRAFCQAGRGLGAAHAAGLVHRDIKPDNLLRGDDGRVRVADFGLAAWELDGTPRGGGVGAMPGAMPGVFAGAFIDAEGLTVTGARPGTPAYMAPEQHLGEEVTAASDQFSFCVSLFEALAGYRPHEGHDRAALLRNVCAGRLRPLPGRVPRPVARALRRGLSPVVARRFPSMTALCDALESAARRRVHVGPVGKALGLAAALALASQLAPISGAPERAQINAVPGPELWRPLLPGRYGGRVYGGSAYGGSRYGGAPPVARAEPGARVSAAEPGPAADDGDH